MYGKRATSLLSRMALLFYVLPMLANAQPPSVIDAVAKGHRAILVASGCFIAHRRADLAPERHMPRGYAAYELAAAGKMVHELITHGANANDRDVDGRTPLMMAAMQGWSDAALELLRAKAAVNARDSEGRLAIDYADSADARTVRVLKKFGSMPVTGNSGRSVCDAERALPSSDTAWLSRIASGIAIFTQPFSDFSRNTDSLLTASSIPQHVQSLASADARRRSAILTEPGLPSATVDR